MVRQFTESAMREGADRATGAWAPAKSPEITTASAPNRAEAGWDEHHKWRDGGQTRIKQRAVKRLRGGDGWYRAARPQAGPTPTTTTNSPAAAQGWNGRGENAVASRPHIYLRVRMAAANGSAKATDRASVPGESRGGRRRSRPPQRGCEERTTRRGGLRSVPRHSPSLWAGITQTQATRRSGTGWRCARLRWTPARWRAHLERGGSTCSGRGRPV